tara:strand:- start:622 stop:912 length:291 start_codon:yes stop_codon:yes gene_type:complete
MHKKTSTIRGLKVGDLVYHLLYGREWVGVIIDILDVYTDNDKMKHRTEMAIVKMQPGTKYATFFEHMVSRSNKLTDSMGLVTTNWLFRLEKEKERN